MAGWTSPFKSFCWFFFLSLPWETRHTPSLQTICQVQRQCLWLCKWKKPTKRMQLITKGKAETESLLEASGMTMWLFLTPIYSMTLSTDKWDASVSSQPIFCSFCKWMSWVTHNKPSCQESTNWQVRLLFSKSFDTKSNSKFMNNVLF